MSQKLTPSCPNSAAPSVQSAAAAAALLDLQADLGSVSVRSNMFLCRQVRGQSEALRRHGAHTLANTPLQEAHCKMADAAAASERWEPERLLPDRPPVSALCPG